MKCPRCQQHMERMPESGICPYCSYPCAEYHRRITVIQVVVGALFLSTLLYGGLAGFLELIGGFQPMAPDLPETVLAVTLLAVTVAALMASGFMERAALAESSPAAVLQAALVLGAAAEVPAMAGLVMCLLTGSLAWMAAFIGASWALFLRLGLRLPLYLQRISEHLGPER